MAQGTDDRKPGDVVVETADGNPLMVEGRGWPPLDYDDNRLYAQAPLTEVTLWLLNAALTGVVGNLAYDILKDTIGEARDIHATRIPQLWTRHFRRPDRSDQPRIEASEELRDKLITVAHDTITRYQHISPTQGKAIWSEAHVTFSATGTWKVRVREVDAQTVFTVEIDLREDVDGGFPVKIWY